MHTFMAPILLRAAGLDTLDINAQSQPPNRELTQTEQGVGGSEGNAVIGPNGCWQSVFLEDSLEDSKSKG